MSGAEFDVAVVGAGPAGTSAAITAARLGAKVVLLESVEFPRHKVCGEFVSSESLDILRDLLRGAAGADELFQSAPTIDQTRLFLAGRVVTARVTPSALSIPRYDLDNCLWHAAKQAGVESRSSCEVRAIHGTGPFRLETAAGKVSTRTVVVAAGRWSKFMSPSALPSGPKWIGIKAHYREQPPACSTDLYFFDHGYCGVQPVAGDAVNAVNACAMVRSDRATSLEEVFALHPALAERSRNWQPIMEALTTAPLLHLPAHPIRDNMTFVGDAAAFIDPFVGDGISIALRSGRLAARCLRSFLVGAGSLSSGVTAYGGEYMQQFVPLITAASQIRSVLSWPAAARMFAFELLRVPGVMPYIVRRTRRAA